MVPVVAYHPPPSTVSVPGSHRMFDLSVKLATINTRLINFLKLNEARILIIDGSSEDIYTGFSPQFFFAALISIFNIYIIFCQNIIFLNKNIGNIKKIKYYFIIECGSSINFPRFWNDGNFFTVFTEIIIFNTVTVFNWTCHYKLAAAVIMENCSCK